ncbi:transmembrane protein, putative [Bodo saltans]|uniref:Transmembrane protein, putative n=1 Tax=Bodo saltans TaxID=75058 RepID=A0A0S4J182_BODSA|nr:transmembrane protein, putative [Bodo saltans]|eukprot:CUG29621.1 transmembrane protein, putative [Bodo saltans]
MSSPGKSDWSPSCPFDLDASSTTTPTLVVVPHAYPLPFVRSATSVVVGSSVVAGSLLGGSYGAVHGIQAAMLILRAQALCAEGSSDPATPEELCCDLGTSPTQWRLPGYGGVYLGGVVANTLIVLCSTIMRFATGKFLRRLHLD